MKLQDFDFRIVKPKNKEGGYNSCDNVKCVCNHPFIYGDEAKYMLSEYIDDENASIELWSGFCDKNGKRIYENDILLDSQGDKYVVSIYDESRNWILLKLDLSPCCSLIEILQEGYVEVIGNIHENADDLKQADTKQKSRI